MIPNFGARIGHFFFLFALATFLLAMVSNASTTAPEFQNISFSLFFPQFDGTNWAATVSILKLCLSMCARQRTEDVFVLSEDVYVLSNVSILIDGRTAIGLALASAVLSRSV